MAHVEDGLAHQIGQPEEGREGWEGDGRDPKRPRHFTTATGARIPQRQSQHHARRLWNKEVGATPLKSARRRDGGTDEPDPQARVCTGRGIRIGEPPKGEAFRPGQLTQQLQAALDTESDCPIGFGEKGSGSRRTVLIDIVISSPSTSIAGWSKGLEWTIPGWSSTVMRTEFHALGHTGRAETSLTRILSNKPI